MAVGNEKANILRGNPLLVVNLALYVVACHAMPFTRTDRMSSVRITVEKVAVSTSPPGNEVTFKVVNNSDQPIWLVDDDWFIWNSSGEITEISYARGKMVSGVEVFGYFDPKVKKIHPSETISRKQHFEWPVRLNGIWNQKEWASPPSGKVKVRLRVGFGYNPNIPSQGTKDLKDIEESVLSWQEEATSEAFEMEIPEYQK